jgi:hypothetical protein
MFPAWLKSQDIDYRQNLKCDLCELLPPSKQVLIGDGTSLGQHKQRFAPYTPPTAEGAPVVPEQRCVV